VHQTEKGGKERGKSKNLAREVLKHLPLVRRGVDDENEREDKKERGNAMS